MIIYIYQFSGSSQIISVIPSIEIAFNFSLIIYFPLQNNLYLIRTKIILRPSQILDLQGQLCLCYALISALPKWEIRSLCAQPFYLQTLSYFLSFLRSWAKWKYPNALVAKRIFFHVICELCFWLFRRFSEVPLKWLLHSCFFSKIREQTLRKIAENTCDFWIAVAYCPVILLATDESVCLKF